MMLSFEELTHLAEECGFTHSGHLDVSTIEIKPEVRAMCEKNTCGSYGKCWSCPPHCGTPEECSERIFRFREGILVQTVGELEDELDGETMMETAAAHKEHFYKMRDALLKEYTEMLSLGSGRCGQCKVCACPDAPCRFPDRRISSMEAYGMLVTDVCQRNGLPYYYGKCTIAYTSCFLLK